MSYETVRYLYCDGPLCRSGDGEPYTIAPNPDESITRQRRQARADGWVHRNGRDLCAECRHLPEEPTP